ncbi:synaptotagmin-13 isoform X2 [Ambystoma mexicanum]|uniref:synaptotagmin-13 isoform X2 n=1 Tax=Ambystoma mexicanum TaxID=8296 RepID=UPI0037E871AD
MFPLPVIALGATLGTATALLALCGVFFVCNCMRTRKGLPDPSLEGASDTSKASVLQSAHKFSVKKTTESIQPKALLKFPNFYSPRLALTSPEIINDSDFSPNPAVEATVPAKQDTSDGTARKTQGIREACDPPQNDLHKDAAIMNTLYPDLSNRNSVPKLHFTLGYNKEKAELVVARLEATGTNEGDEEALCDCYIHGSLTTGTGRTEAQTSLMKKSSHVIWDETLLFSLIELEKPEATLTLTLKNCDRFSRHNISGEIKLNLANVVTPVGAGHWVDMKTLGKEPVDRGVDAASGGEVLLSLSYLPAASRLIVVLIKARDLPSTGLDDLLGKDMSVKVTLRHLSLKLKKKQTKRVKQKISPVWNEMIMFEVPHELLGASSVELEMLCQHKPGGPYHVLGRCRLGLQSGGTERSHWQEMLNNPRRQIAMWHLLHQ